MKTATELSKRITELTSEINAKKSVGITDQELQPLVDELNQLTSDKDAIIAEWKEKYGVVHEITVGNKKAFLKKFDRKTVSLALTFLTKDILQFGESLAVNNWIEGDEEIYKDGETAAPFSDALYDIVQGQKAEYVKH